VKAIEISGVSKSYPLSDSQWARLRHVFAGKAGDAGIWALRDVSFTVDRGEAIGIVGSNGSGKSTLLQIIAGILRPTSGTIELSGRLSALLELGSGFSPQFTGRENLRLNAAVLGLTADEIGARTESIIAFSGVGDFIDQPVRTWSSGMVLRLAFAVASHVDPEILIVDEALAVGDIAFRQRCLRRIHDLRAAGVTILFVSHDPGDVKALCDRCVWLDHGNLRAIGGADEIAAAYLSETIARQRTSDRAVRSSRGATHAAVVLPALSGRHRYGNMRALVTGAELVGAWQHRQPVVLRVSFRAEARITEPIAGFLVRNQRGETILGSNTFHEEYPMPLLEPGDTHTADFHFVPPQLAPGKYFLSVGVSEGTIDHFDVCDYVEDAIEVEAASGVERGYVRLRCSDITVHQG
jgi:ABC-type polysaccharide/polyol phosphate transport system ATPase subunit